MKPVFTGYFFCVTQWSLYRITIPDDLVSRPTVHKWATNITAAELGHELHVPVTGTLRRGHHLGVTSLGIFQYNMPLGHTGPPLPFEEIPGYLRGKDTTQTTPIVGLFFDRKSAEVCHEVVLDKLNLNGSFRPKWWWDTRTVLTTIGTEHPLITISITPGKFSVPRFLWNEHEPVPPITELLKGE